jgi:hypothetical protein
MHINAITTQNSQQMIIEKNEYCRDRNIYEDIAKICNCKEKVVRKVIYSFLDSYIALMDKRDVILAELEVCEQLLKYNLGEVDKNILKKK